MNFRDRPEVAAFAAAVRAGDGAAAPVLCDLLDEWGATAADVCTLYGRPPPWPGARRVQLFVTELDVASSRGDRLALAAQRVEHDLSKDGFRPGPVRSDFDAAKRAWRLTGNSTPPPPADDDSLRPVLAAWADRHGPPGRAADVRAWGQPRQWDRPGTWWGVDGPSGYILSRPTESAVRRELKRRVLGLWPEVRVPCPACGGRGDGEQVYCMPCGGSGTVAPAGLIPPAPSAPHLESIVVGAALRGREAEIVAEINRSLRDVRP